MGDLIIPSLKRDYLVTLLKDGKRLDGRGPEDYRDIKVEIDVSGKAEGSAKVTLGKTSIIAGVKMILGQPFSDTPAAGVLTTNAELSPLASPTFEKGPPGPVAIELARVVDRGIRESHCIDLEKLCVTEGELVWIVFVDFHILDYHGNLFDAAALAAIAALKSAHVPKVEEETNRVLYDEKSDEKLPMRDTPVEVTWAKIGDKILLDPNLEEEQSLDARLTVAYTENGDICAMQKGGGSGTFTSEEIIEIVNKGRLKAEELRKLIK